MLFKVANSKFLFLKETRECIKNPIQRQKSVRNAEFHLRSILGNQNHRTKFKEVNRYHNRGKICVEMAAAALPPL